MKCPACHFENPADTNFYGKCATPLPSPKTIKPEFTETLQTPVKELATGSNFAGRYQVIEELGKGGMGRFYKVFDTKIKEKIARAFFECYGEKSGRLPAKLPPCLTDMNLGDTLSLRRGRKMIPSRIRMRPKPRADKEFFILYRREFSEVPAKPLR